MCTVVRNNVPPPHCHRKNEPVFVGWGNTCRQHFWNVYKSSVKRLTQKQFSFWEMSGIISPHWGLTKSHGVGITHKAQFGCPIVCRTLCRLPFCNEFTSRFSRGKRSRFSLFLEANRRGKPTSEDKSILWAVRRVLLPMQEADELQRFFICSSPGGALGDPLGALKVV